jgi:carotenoid cleavage dioxygenase-like enzyme
MSYEKDDNESKVNILCCRMKPTSILFYVGYIQPPGTKTDEHCRLFYYQFNLTTEHINKQWALTAIEIEFMHPAPNLATSDARFVYSCSTRSGTFNEALGVGIRSDCLIKVDGAELLNRSSRDSPVLLSEYCSGRSIWKAIESDGSADPVTVSQLPDGLYAQECLFISRDGVVGQR